MPIEFEGGGSGYSLGVEEELHIVDATTGELVPKIEQIMARLPKELCKFVSYELFQSVMEIKTPPCATAAETERHLREMRGRVGSWAAACGASLASAGTHPFSRYRDQKATDQDRYQKVIETLRRVAELRPARPRRRPGRGEGHRGSQPPLREGPAPARPLGQFPFLAELRHRLRVEPGQDLRDLPPRRPPPRLPRLGFFRGLRRPHGGLWRHG